MHQVQKQNAAQQTKDVVYTGKTLAGADIGETLQVGYPVCYDYGNIDAGKEAEQLYDRVTKPEAGNLHLFAGVVSRISKPNETGQQTISIVTKGIANVWSDVNATIGVTWLKVVAGWAVQGNSAVSDVDDLGEAIGVAGETKDTDTTNGPIRTLINSKWG